MALSRKKAFLLIFIGASLWGIIGIFVNQLYKTGFTPLQVVALRVITAAALLVLYVSLRNRRLLIIKPTDTHYFIGTGIISIVFFNWCLFSAIEETSISIAFVLLYTAPMFVTLLSRIFFKESLTARKIFSLVTTFTGCGLVIGLFPGWNASLSFYGLLLGLGSGLFYALYSIFGKFVLKKYRSLTVTVYTFLLAAIGVFPFSRLWETGELLISAKVLLLVLGLGLVSTVLPFLFYTKGLETVESSRASIIATIEPVVATFVGYFIFAEKMDIWQYAGVGLVILSVIIVQESKRTHSIAESKSVAG